MVVVNLSIIFEIIDYVITSSILYGYKILWFEPKVYNLNTIVRCNKFGILKRDKAAISPIVTNVNISISTKF